MRVKMLNSRVGVSETFNGGDEYDLPKARALRWVEYGFAEPVTTISEPVVEIAVAVPECEVAPAVTEREAAVVVPAMETAVKRGRPRK